MHSTLGCYLATVFSAFNYDPQIKQVFGNKWTHLCHSRWQGCKPRAPWHCIQEDNVLLRTF